MDDYKQRLKNEIADFRAAGHKFVNKEISVAEFKGISGGMGVYAQRGGEKFMIRLRIHSGVLNYKNLKLVTGFAKKYGLQHIHLTTRQAIQLHDLDIDAVCDIMAAALEEGLYSRGSGGNFPRNVALSPLSGVEREEAFDVTPYALLVSNYLMDRMTEYHLPRKLKISFSNNEKDSGNSTVNDLGFLAVMHEGEPFFKVFLAGGLGNNPEIAFSYDELVSPKDVLYHVEAITRLFSAEGDFLNKAKARLRYVRKRMGEETFLKCYKDYLTQVKAELKLEEIDTVKAELKLEEVNAMEQGEINEKQDEELYLIPQRQKGLYTVNLHPFCGQMKTEDLEKLISFIEKNQRNLTVSDLQPLDSTDNITKEKNIEIRLSMTESMYLRNLTYHQAREILSLIKEEEKISKIRMSISCIGVPTCQIGIEESQDLLKSIFLALEKSQVDDKYLPSVHISGCLNSCSRHQVSSIGFAGCKKKGSDGPVDAFELHVGGTIGKDTTSFGKIIGTLKKEEIPGFIVELAKKLNQEGKEFEKFLIENTGEFETLVSPYLIV